MGAVAVITALDHPASSRKRLRVWLDHELWRTTNSGVGRALELAAGVEVSPDDLSRQLDEEEGRAAREHALRYLTYRARSHGELERRLQEQGYGSSAVRGTLEWLSASGYLDDVAFAEQWIAERVRVKQYGRLRIVAELVAKGIDPDAVADILDEHCPEAGERARAVRLARKRLAGKRGLDRLVAARRLGAYLLRKGYPSGVVRSVVADVVNEYEEDAAEREVGATG